jgi:hypothetical protein
MASKLGNFIGNYRRKNKMIKLGLNMLAACEASAAKAHLCLANPKPDAEGFIDWTVVPKDLPNDEREAVVTRRVLAGYLPLGCLLRKGDNLRMVIDKTCVPADLRDVYVAFARMEMNFIAATIDGKVNPDDGALKPFYFSDLSYPGQPVKPRKPGTIKVEVDIRNRSVRIISEPIASCLDLPIDDDMLDGQSEEGDAIYVAGHVIEALENVPPPKGTVRGDILEVYLVQAEGTPKFLARAVAEGSHEGLIGEFGMGGNA